MRSTTKTLRLARPPALAPAAPTTGPRVPPAAPWLAASAAALLLDLPAAVGGPLFAALAVLALHREPALAVLAAAAAVLGAQAAAGEAWFLAGASLALLPSARPRAGTARPGRPDEVVLALARCRRRAAAADVVVAACADHPAAHALVAGLRLSDSARVAGTEVHAVLDRDGLDRDAFEARVARVAPARFGWARYPEDGLVLDDLVAAARRPAPRRTPSGAGTRTTAEALPALDVPAALGAATTMPAPAPLGAPPAAGPLPSRPVPAVAAATARPAAGPTGRP